MKSLLLVLLLFVCACATQNKKEAPLNTINFDTHSIVLAKFDINVNSKAMNSCSVKIESADGKSKWYKLSNDNYLFLALPKGNTKFETLDCKDFTARKLLQKSPSFYLDEDDSMVYLGSINVNGQSDPSSTGLTSKYKVNYEYTSKDQWARDYTAYKQRFNDNRDLDVKRAFIFK